MKKEDILFDSIEYVDDALLSEADMPISRKSHSTWWKWAGIAACLCLVGGIAFAIFHTAQPIPPAQSEINIPTEHTTENTSQTQSTVTPQTAHTMSQTTTAPMFIDNEEESISLWQNKILKNGLFQAVQNANSGDLLEIVALSPKDYDFIYQGISLYDYYTAMGTEQDLPDKLGQLLKEGDALKYGTALYETGTPDGEQWYQSLYEERIAFYGDDILSRYLIDGEFLKEKLEQDLQASFSMHEAKDAYHEAFHAYLSSLADEIHFAQPCEVHMDEILNTETLLLHCTKDEFSAFTPENISEWIFMLPPSPNDCDDE